MTVEAQEIKRSTSQAMLWDDQEFLRWPTNFVFCGARLVEKRGLDVEGYPAVRDIVEAEPEHGLRHTI